MNFRPFTFIFLLKYSLLNDSIQIPLYSANNIPYIKIFLGSDQQELNIIFDTGSSELIIKKDDCLTCHFQENFQNNQMFVSEKSKTLQYDKEKNSRIAYLDGTYAMTNPAMDTMRIEGNTSLPLEKSFFNFRLIHELSGSLNFDGIMGVKHYGDSSVKKKRKLEQEYGFPNWVFENYSIKNKIMILDSKNKKLIFGQDLDSYTSNGKDDLSEKTPEEKKFEKKTFFIKKIMKKLSSYFNSKIPKILSLEDLKNNFSFSKAISYFENSINHGRLDIKNIIIDDKNVSENLVGVLDTGSTHIFLPEKHFEKLIKRIKRSIPDIYKYIDYCTLKNPFDYLSEQTKPKITMTSINEETGKLDYFNINLFQEYEFNGKIFICLQIAKIKDVDIAIIGFPFYSSRIVEYDYDKNKIRTSEIDGKSVDIPKFFEFVSKVLMFTLLIG